MGSSLVITVSHAQKSYLASSKTAVGSLVIRKSRALDHRYVRELPIRLGGAKAQLITRKFRAMLYDKERLMLTCELSGMVCAFVALKSTQVTTDGDQSGVLMIEYFHVCGYDRAAQLAEVLESAVIKMADGTVEVGVEIAHLNNTGWDIYCNRGYQLIGNILRKKIK